MDGCSRGRGCHGRAAERGARGRRVFGWCSSSCRTKRPWRRWRRGARTSTTASSTPPAGASWSAPSSTTTRRPSFEAQGYRGRQDPPDPGRRRRAARRARRHDRRRGRRQVRADELGRLQGQERLAGTVRAQRADYWEDVFGRYLSIEGTTTAGRDHLHGPTAGSCTYTGPALMAAWYAADGTQLGERQPRAVLDPDVTPAAYLYHGHRFRIGNVGDGGMPAYVRIAAPNGDVARSTPRSGSATAAPRAPAASSRTSTRTTSRRVRATPRCASSPTSSRTSPRLMNLPNKTNGYQRKAQTILGIRPRPYAGATSASADGRPAARRSC